MDPGDAKNTMFDKEPPPFVYINGYAGVGKFTIAKRLVPLLPQPTKLVHNHLLIEPVAAIFGRTSSEYQPLRKSVRQLMLSTICNSEELNSSILVFTDQQSSSPLGSSVAMEYHAAALKRKSRFFSIRLECKEDEHLRRAVSEDRLRSELTKLTDESLIKRIRNNEDIYKFSGDDELTIDVTDLSPNEAAQRISEFVQSRLAISSDRRVTAMLNFEDIKSFKHLFIQSLKSKPVNSEVSFLAWVAYRPRCLGKVCFLDVVDSTGIIQVVVEATALEKQGDWTTIRSLLPESSVTIRGILKRQMDSSPNSMTTEVHAKSIAVISMASKTLHPAIRCPSLDILAPEHAPRILAKPHLYLRNPVSINIGKFRAEVLRSVRQWFYSHAFLELSAPLMTASTLYEPNSALTIGNLVKGDKPIFLSQCAGFYLEAAAHAHERVYNLGPSFRNESRTNRHLMEYWHIKAEIASGTLDDIISLVEIFLRDIRNDVEASGTPLASSLATIFPSVFQLPFPRITYLEAQEYLSDLDPGIEFGQNISGKQERQLTEHFCKERLSPLWITHKPRQLEPFPYSIHPTDVRLTMTADLVAPNGYGEICGVAEKSYRLSDLDERLQEKKKAGAEEYQWVRELREFGMVPHVAFGMGLERLLRWWIGARHVKDTIPFPRVFGRIPLP